MTAPRPPVTVALARTVFALPTEGRWAYEPKFDGYRLVVFRTDDTVQLQARSGRLVTPAFPDLADAAAHLPPGTVVDGEVVVWRAGRTDFSAVARRAAAAGAHRAAALARTLPASYAAFDLLAAGDEDLRPRPYDHRRAQLVAVLGSLGPPLQPVPSTTDPDLAATWYDTLPATGIEGLVIKGRDQPYPGGRRGWRKLRHSEPRDALVIGVVGPRSRPRALVLTLPDDDTPLLSGTLEPAVRAQLVPALRQLPPGGGESALIDDTPYEPVEPLLTVEVQYGTTVRHAATRVLRLRAD